MRLVLCGSAAAVWAVHRVDSGRVERTPITSNLGAPILAAVVPVLVVQYFSAPRTTLSPIASRSAGLSGGWGVDSPQDRFLGDDAGAEGGVEQLL